MHDNNGTLIVEYERAFRRATEMDSDTVRVVEQAEGAALAVQLIILALQRLHSQLPRSEDGSSAATLRMLIERLEPLLEIARYKRRLLVKEKDEYSFVFAEEIEWIEAQGNYVGLHLNDGGMHLIRATLSDIESELDPDLFLRIHRGAIVNLDQVTSIKHKGGSDYRVLLRSGRHINVGRTYRDALLQRQD